MSTLFLLSGIKSKKWNNENFEVNKKEILLHLTKSSVVELSWDIIEPKC